MSDSELGGWLRQAGGRAFVGLKRPGQARGVSERGERLLEQAEELPLKAQLTGLGLTFEREFELIPSVVARLTSDQLGAVRRLPFVDYVEPILPGRRMGQDTTWNLRQVGTPFAWEVTSGAGVNILIIDSGRDQSHEDLGDVVSMTCVGGDPWDRYGHGTFVTGIVRASNNAVGVVGGSYNAQVFTERDGDKDPDPSGTACGVEWGRTHGVFVVNISTGFLQEYQALTDEINGAYNQDNMLIVAAAGNFGQSSGFIAFPASLPSVIAVGATTSGDVRAPFSSYGPKLELVAPGQDVQSTSLRSGTSADTTCIDSSGYGFCDGTSFAAPHVTFAAALVKAQSPNLTNVQVRARLQETALDLGDVGRDDFYGYGRLDVGSALGAGGPNPVRSAAISGPDCIHAAGSYSYSGSAIGGVLPYRFQWSEDIAPFEGQYDPVGEGTPINIFFGGGNYSVRLKLRVTDAVGSIAEIVSVVLVAAGANAPAVTGGSRDATSCTP